MASPGLCEVGGVPNPTSTSIFDVSDTLDCDAGEEGRVLQRLDFTSTSITGTCIGATTGQTKAAVEIPLSFQIVYLASTFEVVCCGVVQAHLGHVGV